MRMMMRLKKVGSSGENRRWRQEENILTGSATGSTIPILCTVYSTMHILFTVYSTMHILCTVYSTMPILCSLYCILNNVHTMYTVTVCIL